MKNEIYLATLLENKEQLLKLLTESQTTNLFMIEKLFSEIQSIKKEIAKIKARKGTP